VPAHVIGVADPDDADFTAMLQFGESTIRHSCPKDSLQLVWQAVDVRDINGCTKRRFRAEDIVVGEQNLTLGGLEYCLPLWRNGDLIVRH
jgi:hypothetical protein